MNRDFKGIWIPKDIWLDTRLSALDKVILAEIDSLDNNLEGCYASNEYLSKFCQCSPSKVSTTISKLIKLEYLYVTKFDGRKRFLKSRLLKINRLGIKNSYSGYENLKEINIDNNIDNNNKKKKEPIELFDYDWINEEE